MGPHKTSKKQWALKMQLPRMGRYVMAIFFFRVWINRRWARSVTSFYSEKYDLQNEMKYL